MKYFRISTFCRDNLLVLFFCLVIFILKHFIGTTYLFIFIKNPGLRSDAGAIKKIRLGDDNELLQQ